MLYCPNCHNSDSQTLLVRQDAKGKSIHCRLCGEVSRIEVQTNPLPAPKSTRGESGGMRPVMGQPYTAARSRSMPARPAKTVPEQSSALDQMCMEIAQEIISTDPVSRDRINRLEDTLKRYAATDASHANALIRSIWRMFRTRRQVMRPEDTDCMKILADRYTPPRTGLIDPLLELVDYYLRNQRYTEGEIFNEMVIATDPLCAQAWQNRDCIDRNLHPSHNAALVDAWMNLCTGFETYCSLAGHKTSPDRAPTQLPAPGDMVLKGGVTLQKRDKQDISAIICNCAMSVVQLNCTSAGDAPGDCSGQVDLIIPYGTKIVERYAFNGRSDIRRVAVPHGVRRIEDAAFRMCMQMTEIALPDTVTSIDDLAFYGCIALPEVSLPTALKRIGESAFHHCASLTEIAVPDGVIEIAEYAFFECVNLRRVSLPAGITSIGWAAFFRCHNLTDVDYAGTCADWKRLGTDRKEHECLPYGCIVHCKDGQITIPYPEEG